MNSEELTKIEELVQTKWSECDNKLRFFPGTNEMDFCENKTFAEQIESLKYEFD